MFYTLLLAVFASFAIGLVAGVAAGWFTRPQQLRIPDPQGGVPVPTAAEKGLDVGTGEVIQLVTRRRAA